METFSSYGNLQSSVKVKALNYKSSLQSQQLTLTVAQDSVCVAVSEEVYSFQSATVNLTILSNCFPFAMSYKWFGHPCWNYYEQVSF